MWKREMIVGFRSLELMEDDGMSKGSVRFEMSATRAKRIMMNVAWRME